MGSKKIYAVAVGRKPGIYSSWPEVERQVKGYPSARYKGFAAREEAEIWLRQAASDRGCKGRGASVPSAAAPSARRGGIEIYTDGGALNNPGPGGYGVILVQGGDETEFGGGYRLTTNNRMELMACIVALRRLEKKDMPITLHSDSSYVVNGITKGWAKKWRRNGWIKSDGKPALNRDLWAELLDLIDGLDIAFVWVKGHAGHPLNERCDRIAVGFSRSPGLPQDVGYETAQGSPLPA